MTHVKICGFRSADAAETAVRAGADAVGLVFIPSAHRHLTLDQADRLLVGLRAGVGGGTIEVVGLFGDQSADEVNEHVGRLKLDAVQLCGSEGMAFCREMHVPIYKVIGIDPQVPTSAQLPRVMVLQQRHQLAGHRIVIDTKVSGEYGGTGLRFDWALAAGLARAFPMSMAGGLTPDNVGEVVRTVRPWGVDTSSGVETDGEKDPEKVQAFVRAVQEADEALAPHGLRRLFGRR